MGNNKSYLKIKNNSHFLGIIFLYNNEYKKIIIVTHPDNSFTYVNLSSEQEYNNYGNYYIYDGDMQKLNKILIEFNPYYDHKNILFSRLITECNLEKCEIFWKRMSIFMRRFYLIKLKKENNQSKKKIENNFL